MLTPAPTLDDIRGQLAAAINAKRAALDQHQRELEAMERGLAALGESVGIGASSRRQIRPTRVAPPVPAPTTAPASAPYVSPMRAPQPTEGPAAAEADESDRYPDVTRRRARVLGILPLRDDLRCAEIARRLDLPQSHVQTDLEKLLEQGLVERVGWGRWKRATVDEVVWSGRDPLLPTSEVTTQP